MDTMSVIEIPLMLEAFRQIEAGKFQLTDRAVLHAEDKLPGTGVIRSLDDGAQLTVKDLLTLMIIVSDNTATDIMFRKIGGIEPVNDVMKTHGVKQTRATAPARSWFDALRADPIWRTRLLLSGNRLRITKASGTDGITRENSSATSARCASRTRKAASRRAQTSRPYRPASGCRSLSAQPFLPPRTK
jgi:Beta-lactamase enzyme family